MAPPTQAHGAVVIRLADRRPHRSASRRDVWIAVVAAAALAALLLGMARPSDARAGAGARDLTTLLPD